MKKTKNPSLLVVMFVFCSVIISTLFGGAAVYADKESCLSDSGGRRNIKAVQQACQWYADAGMSGYPSDGSGNFCALWLGGTDSIDPTIYVDSLSEKVTIYYYGMCTVKAKPAAASKAWVENANDSIAQRENLSRGTWAYPKETPTTLDVAKFIDVADGPYNRPDGIAYQKEVSVHRCISNGSSCDSMDETVTVVVRRHTETSVKYDYEYEYEYDYEDGAEYDYSSRDFGVTGKTSINDISDVIYNSATDTYESTNTENEVTFKHTLRQENNEGYAIDINYGLNGYLGNRGTLSSGRTYGYNDDATERVRARLSTGDSYSEACQYISFNPKSWRINYDYTYTYRYTYKYNYRHDYKITTTEEYVGSTLVDSNYDVEDLGRTLVGVELIGTDFVGTNIDKSLTNFGDTGNSTAACVKIHRPWNFKISSIKSQGNSNEITYAGESISVKDFEITVNKNDNNYLITDIPNATIKVVGYTVGAGASDYQVREVGYNVGNIESYYGGTVPGFNGFYELATVERRIYRSGMDSSTDYRYYKDIATYSFSAKPVNSISVPDVAAGTRFCIALAISPANSGNGYVSGFNSNWTISDSYCYIIGKKPSFQVWGGGISARGTIITSASNKSLFNVRGGMISVNDPIVFGSWVEQESKTTGATELLSTGAATGNNENYANSVRVGGSQERPSSFCKYRVPLSFANYSDATNLICSKNNMGNVAVGYSGISLSDSDGSELLDYLMNGVDVSSLRNFNGTISLNDAASYDVARNVDGREVRYTRGEGNLTINGNTLGNGITHIVKTAGDVVIKGNLQYTSAPYNSLSDIPKLIIYAKNIFIDCGVARVDAILMADEIVNTCVSGGTTTPSDKNAEARSKQLTINGAIIARKLELERTYGAAAGVNSGTPAEIINYDMSAMLWGRGSAEDTNQNSFTTVYQKEIAPRH